MLDNTLGSKPITIGYGFQVLSKLLILDQFANLAYEWARRNCNHSKELKNFMESFDLEPLTILNFHLVCLFSWGEVLEWILYYILVILGAFQQSKAYWYQQVTTF
jgi:hypothetical protein